MFLNLVFYNFISFLFFTPIFSLFVCSFSFSNYALGAVPVIEAEGEKLVCNILKNQILWGSDSGT